MRDSQITFKDISKDLAYTLVMWNGVTIFNEDIDNLCEEELRWYEAEYLATHTGISGLKYIQETYADKKVYSYHVIIHSGHHCNLYIEGEE